MGGALLARWLEAGVVARDAVSVCVADEQAAVQVSTVHGVSCGTSLPAALETADVVVVAVKPQQRVQVLQAAAQARPGSEGPLWVSILAAVTVPQLLLGLGSSARVLRWMPNTPVAVGQGVVAWSAGPGLTSHDMARQQQLLHPLGLTLPLAEEQFDSFTAVAGCGPAYVFALCEALQRAGQEAGLGSQQAAALARQTLIGSAWQLSADLRSPGQLREAVTSKGGMTEAALERLQQLGWQDAMVAAVQAAVRRAGQLSNGE